VVQINRQVPRIPGIEDIILVGSKHAHGTIRSFAVYGSIVVTGHKDVTRIHHLPSGRLVSSITHTDMKATAMVWRPSHLKEEVGIILWIGFQNGEVWSVDILGRSRAPASRVASFSATLHHSGNLADLPGGMMAPASPVVLERKKVSARGKRIVHMFTYKMQIWIIDEDNVFSLFESQVYSSILVNLVAGEGASLPLREPFMPGQPALSLESKTSVSFRFSPVHPNPTNAMSNAAVVVTPSTIANPNLEIGMGSLNLKEPSLTGGLGQAATPTSSSSNLHQAAVEDTENPSVYTLPILDGIPFIWICHSKHPRMIDVFNPTMHSSRPFVVGSMPVPTGVGNVTALASFPPFASSQIEDLRSLIGCVLSGHDDGKIVMWDHVHRTPLQVIAASAYKVTSITVPLLGWVWVGFSTSKIQVYRVKPSLDQVNAPEWVLVKEFFSNSGEKGRIIKLIPCPRFDCPTLVSGQSQVGEVMQVAPVHTIAVGTQWQDGAAVTLLDADLLEDWLGIQMLRHEPLYSSINLIRVQVCSWNLDSCSPKDVAGNSGMHHQRSESGELLGLMLDEPPEGQLIDIPSSQSVRPSRNVETLTKLEDWLGVTIRNMETAPEVIVVGFQETVDLEDKKKQATSFLKSRKSKSPQAAANDKQHQLWQDAVIEAVRVAHSAAGHAYQVLVQQYLVGLATLVLVRRDISPRVDLVDVEQVKTGMKGYHGNKGALVVRFCIDDSSFCFIVAHLAAGQDDLSSRNKNAIAILDEPVFKSTGDKFAFSSSGRSVHDHHYVWFVGDLNYRIDMNRDKLVSTLNEIQIAQGGTGAPTFPSFSAATTSSLVSTSFQKHHEVIAAWQQLWSQDQLIKMRHGAKHLGHSFALSSFMEAPLAFSPTYKYDVGSDVWDSSDKQRAPAWCDRILFRSATTTLPIVQKLYTDLDTYLDTPIAQLIGSKMELEPDSFGFLPIIPDPIISNLPDQEMKRFLSTLGTVCTRYSRMESQVSDHRPIYGTFVVRTKKEDPDQRLVIQSKLIASTRKKILTSWFSSFSERALWLGFDRTIVDHVLHTFGVGGPGNEDEVWRHLWDKQVNSLGYKVT
jgi:hypothetical protein